VEQDLGVKEDLHRQEINHMQRKLNEASRSTFKAAPFESTRYFANENTMTKRTRAHRSRSPDAETTSRTRIEDATPRSLHNSGYLTVLNSEFQKIADELVKVRGFLHGKDAQNALSFLAKHTKQFDQFKVKVLDALVNWHRKSDELAKLANKHSETLEQYQLVFVQIRQLVKDKDALIKRMQA